MGGQRFSEIELLRDGNFELRFFDRAIEAVEFPRTRRAVVSLDADSLSFARLRLDAVRIRHPPALPQRIETAGELFAASEREDCVDALRRELACGFENVGAF